MARRAQADVGTWVFVLFVVIFYIGLFVLLAIGGQSKLSSKNICPGNTISCSSPSIGLFSGLFYTLSALPWYLNFLIFGSLTIVMLFIALEILGADFGKLLGGLL